MNTWHHHWFFPHGIRMATCPHARRATNKGYVMYVRLQLIKVIYNYTFIIQCKVPNVESYKFSTLT